MDTIKVSGLIVDLTFECRGVLNGIPGEIVIGVVGHERFNSRPFLLATKGAWIESLLEVLDNMAKYLSNGVVDRLLEGYSTVRFGELCKLKRGLSFPLFRTNEFGTWKVEPGKNFNAHQPYFSVVLVE